MLAALVAASLVAVKRYAGGTLAGLADAGCVAARNRTHLRELTSLLHELRSP